MNQRCKKTQQNWRKNRLPGISLIEMLIAIFVITTLAAGAGMLVATALRTSSASQTRLTALSLAMEGIEAMRVIYNTNLLRYPLHRDLCWNVATWEPSGCDIDPSDGDSNVYLATGTYRAVMNGGAWILEETIAPTDTQLYQNDEGQYLHDAALPTQSPYSRAIEIEWPLAGASVPDDFMRVTSRVTWNIQGIPRELVLTENFTAIPSSS